MINYQISKIIKYGLFITLTGVLSLSGCGGVKGGQAVGASDPIGGVPADRPVGPGEVVSTIFHSLGLDLDTILPGPAGRPFPIVDFGKREIHELF